MPRSSAQSDFVIESETDPVALPKATWRTDQASARATTLVYWAVGLTLLLLLLLTTIGPHIPSGE